MSRESKLLKNTGIIAIGQLSSKLLSFLLLPLYTNLLLPDDFGIVDVLQTIISLVVYFATLQMESAVFRYIIENRDDEKRNAAVISSGLLVVFAGNIIFTLLSILVNIFFTIPHILPFVLSFWGLSFSGVMLNVARGNGKNGLYSIASFSITMSFLLTNIIMIVVLHFGAVSILWSLSLSNFIGGIVVFVSERCYKTIRIGVFDHALVKEMLAYSVPLIPNAISWWVANASDRFIIALFLGSTFNGIYAAANKIPTIYLTLFNVFNLAWTESVIVNLKDYDSQDYINRVFSNSVKLFSFIIVAIISVIGLTFNWLIGSDYNDAYPHVLILLIAIFFNSICSMYGGIFSGFKDTKAISITTIYGAVCNLCINFLLIRLCGLYAASVSTLVSYIVILIFRELYCRKSIRIQWPRLYIIRFVLILFGVSICYVSKSKIAIAFSLLIVISWGWAENKETIKMFISNILRRF